MQALQGTWWRCASSAPEAIRICQCVPHTRPITSRRYPLSGVDMRCKLVFLLMCAGALFGISPAHAWNKPGHMVSAAIAYDDLRARAPSVVAKVVVALRKHPQYDQRWRADVEATDLSEDESNRRLFHVGGEVARRRAWQPNLRPTRRPLHRLAVQASRSAVIGPCE
jgi:hypothetical protein